MLDIWILILGLIFYCFVFALVFVYSDKFYENFSKLFPKPIRLTLLKYDDFRSNETKKNFSNWFIFIFLVYISIALLSFFVTSILLVIFSLTLSLLLLFPTYAIYSRRLKTNNYSNKNLLFFFIPFGFIIPTLLCLVNPRNFRSRSGLIFNNPFYKDWVFIVWLVFTFLSSVTAIERVIKDGGPYFNLFSLISGTFDALIYPLIGFILTVLPLSLLRRLYRIYRK